MRAGGRGDLHEEDVGVALALPTAVGALGARRPLAVALPLGVSKGVSWQGGVKKPEPDRDRDRDRGWPRDGTNTELASPAGVAHVLLPDLHLLLAGMPKAENPRAVTGRALCTLGLRFQMWTGNPGPSFLGVFEIEVWVRPLDRSFVRENLRDSSRRDLGREGYRRGGAPGGELSPQIIETAF